MNRRYAGGSSAQSAGRSEASGTGAAVAELKSLDWLEDAPHPLDWNGPADRIFTRFREEELGRPIIDQFEGVARRHRNRIAIIDLETSLSFSDLWDGLSGLAETIAAETKPGDLVGILLPTSSMFPLAILAFLG